MTDWGEVLQKLIPDIYDRTARLYPMLLVLLPVFLGFWAIVPENMYDWEAIAGLVFWCGAAALLKELGREKGKLKEKSLWDSWGGAPTTQYLRHRGQTNRVSLTRVHQNLGTVAGVEMPTAEFERTHSREADEVYEECTRVMRQRTRDRKQYPLIFKELCSYGFWRNLWGLKAWGQTLSIISALVVGGVIIFRWRQDEVLESCNPVISEAISVGLVLFWLNVNEKRTRLAAFAYAERLFEASEQLADAQRRQT
jgi:hypothetical protein